MKVSNITLHYDQEGKPAGYTVYVDGASEHVQSFSGQVNLTADELDLSFIKEKIRAKLEESFAAEEK